MIDMLKFRERGNGAGKLIRSEKPGEIEPVQNDHTKAEDVSDDQ